MILIAVCTRQILWPKTRVPTVCSAIVMPVWVIVASSCHSRIERYTSEYQTLEPSSASYKYSRRDIRYHTEPFEAMHYLSLKNIFQLSCSSLLNQLGFVESRSPLRTVEYTLLVRSLMVWKYTLSTTACPPQSLAGCWSQVMYTLDNVLVHYRAVTESQPHVTLRII